MTDPARGGVPRYWLMADGGPAGPFTAAEVHARLASGEVGGDTLACPVGGGDWGPVSATPGLGPPSPAGAAPAAVSTPTTAVPPVAPPRPVASAAVRLPTPAAPPKPAPGRPDKESAVAGLVVLAWVTLMWGVVESPRAVCDKFHAAATPAEMFPLSTVNMRGAIESIFSQPDPEPDDGSTFEYTREGDAPAAVGGSFVGVRWKVMVPEERRRVPVDAVFHVVNSDGWRINDIYVLTYDGVRAPQPFSMARDYAAFAGNQHAGLAPPSAAALGARAWYSDTTQRGTLAWLAVKFPSSVSGKLGLVMAAALALVAFVFRGNAGFARV